MNYGSHLTERVQCSFKLVDLIRQGKPYRRTGSSVGDHEGRLKT